MGLLGAAAVALPALGAGRFSVDRIFGMDQVGTPFSRAVFATGLGIAGAAAQLAAFWRPAR